MKTTRPRSVATLTSAGKAKIWATADDEYLSESPMAPEFVFLLAGEVGHRPPSQVAEAVVLITCELGADVVERSSLGAVQSARICSKIQIAIFRFWGRSISSL